eukprot:CAMPEP_0172588560 /NCGR_PEP_ID=MMETSP1068-20121228/7450_1 /TAXON_ID=35684 /ORGANISM="Pseudopedinella elastica, Strain CCMP716" /LENGTH=141 /DNA_ID=CAMNT_0013383927 /DNA_START=22 /DNA_END=447 /DNA_ORIENTATION=-
MNSLVSRAVCLALMLAGANGFALTQSRVLPKQRTAVVLGVDGNTAGIIGVAVAGLGAGIGIMAFAESRIERSEELGSDVMSEDTKKKLSAQFMEDVEMQSVGIDDVVTKMEKAMAKRKGVEVEELDKDLGEKKVVVKDDGW